MAGDDPLDDLAKRLKEHTPKKKVARSTRTLMMAEPNFRVLQEWCRSKGHTVSDVINELIEKFLDKIKDDLPPSPPKP